MKAGTIRPLLPAARSASAPRERLRSDRRWFVALYAPAVLLLLAVAIASRATGTPLPRFLLDPAVLSVSHPLLGVVSNIGILLWAGAAAIAGFAGSLLLVGGRARELALFLLAAASLTGCLLLDDLFLVHEWLFPVVLGIPQVAVFAGYAVLLAALLWRFRNAILQMDVRLLVLALAFFALSVGTDLLPVAWSLVWNLLYLVEDGLKLLGIVSWCGYLVRTSVFALEQGGGRS
ncbi:MAG: hypothetical protein ACREQZ_06360 [Woeseiaceae bacterium]